MAASFENVEVEGKNTVCVSFDGPRHEAVVDAAGQDGELLVEKCKSRTDRMAKE
jgi:hypothetical protein